MKPSTVSRLVTTMTLLGFAPVFLILGAMFGVAEVLEELVKTFIQIWR